jgi:uncharacterized protein YjbI with pentapeptide repeats
MPEKPPDIAAFTKGLFAAGIDEWNRFRKTYPNEPLVLSGVDFEGADLSGYNLRDVQIVACDLSNVGLRHAKLNGARFGNVVLNEADLFDAQCDGGFFWNVRAKNANCEAASFANATLHEVSFESCRFVHAVLFEARLSDSRFTGSDFTKAWFGRASAVKVNFNNTLLVDCDIHGFSIWDASLVGALQKDLVITDGTPGDPRVTVDDIELGQFLYLLLNNKNIQRAIDTITSKVVLILGRFTPERKAILDAVRNELRKRDYLPVLFDFEKPSSRDITETVSTLAHMARFVIADITDARSIPQELMAIVPALPSVPVQPLLLTSQREYGMFEHFKRFPWVLPAFEYRDEGHVIGSLDSHVIGPAEAKAKEQTGR